MQQEIETGITWYTGREVWYASCNGKVSRAATKELAVAKLQERLGLIPPTPVPATKPEPVAPEQPKPYRVQVTDLHRGKIVIRFKITHRFAPTRPGGLTEATYFVTRERRKAPTCSCWSFRCSENTPKTCKHVQWLQRWMDEEAAKEDWSAE